MAKRTAKNKEPKLELKPLYDMTDEELLEYYVQLRIDFYDYHAAREERRRKMQEKKEESLND